MEPVTHLLTGACLSRALGFPRRARHATLACVLAAELPDADYVYRLGGPITYFQHHRGWTHALWSLPLQAVIVVTLMFAWKYARSAWKKRGSRRSKEVPWRPGLLFLMTLLALLTHLLLDWTNNYGIRPFAPFNPRWYSADLVFIVEPVLLLALSAALLLPLLFSLSDSEMGIRRPRFRGQGLAAAALAVMVALWVWRYNLHSTAVALAANTEFPGGPPLHISANPYPVNPYRWHIVVETPNNFSTGTIDTRETLMQMDQVPTPKPETTLATLAAKHSRLGQVYLDWSKYPVVEDIGTAAEIHPNLDLTPTEAQDSIVRFRDLRFGYDIWGIRATAAALTGEAWVHDNHTVVRQSFGGKVQH